MEIPVSKFKERCLSLVEEVDDEGIVITKHGRPVAKLVPYTEDHGDLIGRMKGSIRITGDIFSTGVHWNAESR